MLIREGSAEARRVPRWTRIVAFVLGLLVPAIPVREVFGAHACVHPAPEVSGSPEHVGSHGDHGGIAADHGPEAGHDAHGSCVWLGPCPTCLVTLQSPTDLPSVVSIESADRVLPPSAVFGPQVSPTAYLRPPANPPPSANV